MKKTALIFYQGDWPAGGLWRYGYSLAQEYLRLDKENDYSIIHGKNIPENFLGLENQEKILPLSNWEKMLLLPKILEKEKFDVVHVTENACPLFGGKKYRKIANIHDLMPLSFPQAVDYKTYLYYRFYLPRALKRVDAIITPSSYSKNDLINFYGIESEKIKVIYYGIASSFFEPVTNEQLFDFKQYYKISEPFILSVSGINFRKNLITVFEAYRLLPANIKKEFKIYLVGKAEKDAEETIGLIKKLDLEKFVRVFGEVPEKDLVFFYKLASVFVFPSLHEGFGFPPLEAMAVGCPVVSSNATCLPETLGDAALLLSPGDILNWRDALVGVLSDHRFSQDLIIKGKKKAKEFGWEKSAREHLNLYYP